MQAVFLILATSVSLVAAKGIRCLEGSHGNTPNPDNKNSTTSVECDDGVDMCMSILETYYRGQWGNLTTYSCAEANLDDDEVKCENTQVDPTNRDIFIRTCICDDGDNCNAASHVTVTSVISILSLLGVHLSAEFKLP